MKEKVRKWIGENKEKSIKIAVFAIVGLVILSVFLINGNKSEDVSSESVADTEIAESAEESADVLIVDISGAVNNPQVVELTADSRISDAIQAAGGLTDDADISQINRAQILQDGEKIYIPKKGEKTGAETASGTSSSSAVGSSGSAGKVNINTAGSDELQKITGVGPATAEKIINYRSANGSFRSPEDLKKVSGIGDKTYEKMKDQISI
jgi:competence protein ComEA